MEAFNVKVSISDNERRKWMDLPAKVDTRAFVMSVPGSIDPVGQRLVPMESIPL